MSEEAPRFTGGTLRWFTVLYLDVLNQRQALVELEASGLKSATRDELLPAVKASLGRLVELREAIDLTIRSATALRSPPALIQHLNLDVDWRDVTCSSAKVFQLADSFIVTDELHTDSGLVRAGSVSILLDIAAGIMAMTMPLGIAVRGAIEVGLGMRIGPTEVYGPAIFRAYQLESETAKWPRVVAGSKLRSLLEGFRRYRPNSQLDEARRAIALDSLRRITSDTCGIDMAHWYRDSSMEPVLRHMPDARERIRDFVRDQRARANALGNQELAERYCDLAHYLRPEDRFNV